VSAAYSLTDRTSETEGEALLHFEILRTESVGKWHARIRGNNGKIIFATQLYKSRESAVLAIDDVKKNAEDAETKEPDIVTLHEDDETRRLRKKLKP
jgi:uncharacterized protein YegP (UPF0339 family)